MGPQSDGTQCWIRIWRLVNSQPVLKFKRCSPWAVSFSNENRNGFRLKLKQQPEFNPIIFGKEVKSSPLGDEETDSFTRLITPARDAQLRVLILDCLRKQRAVCTVLASRKPRYQKMSPSIFEQGFYLFIYFFGFLFWFCLDSRISAQLGNSRLWW